MCPQTQQLYERVAACSELQQKRVHAHTHANAHTHTLCCCCSKTAMQAFDVQGAVSVVHVCTLKSFLALRVKHGNKGKQHIQKCQMTHLAFHVCGIAMTQKQHPSVRMQDSLIDSGCCRGRWVKAAEILNGCQKLSSRKNNCNYNVDK